MGFDTKELQEFSKELRKQAENMERFNEECVKELASCLLAKVVKRTPVGNPPVLKGSKTAKVKGVSGKSKSFLTADGARYAKYWSGYIGGTLRKGWSIGKVEKQGNKYRIEVINNILYASYVEYGHRQTPGRFVPALGVRLKKGWVEGKFMLTLSLKELENEAPGILEKKLEKKLGEIFA